MGAPISLSREVISREDWKLSLMHTKQKSKLAGSRERSTSSSMQSPILAWVTWGARRFTDFSSVSMTITSLPESISRRARLVPNRPRPITKNVDAISIAHLS